MFAQCLLTILFRWDQAKGGDQRMRRRAIIRDVIFFCARGGSFFAGLPLPFGGAFAVIPIDMLVRYWS
jgi:hypothetical protein